MSITSFAFNKATSPIANVTGIITMRHPPAQYMALCHFTSIHWSTDDENNGKPVLVFDGKVERLDTIATKFPNNIDSLYFSSRSGEPGVRFKYDFSEEQLAELCKKGFFSKDGVQLGDILTTAKFQLEVFATVEEVILSREADLAHNVQIEPTGGRLTRVYNVTIENAYNNPMTAEQYDIISYIARKQPEESMAIESQIAYEAVPEEYNIAAQVEAAKLEMERQAAENQAVQSALAASASQTREMMDSQRAGEIAAAMMEEQRRIRDEGNAKAAAARAAMEEAAAAQNPVEEAPVKDPNAVEFSDEKISKVDTEAGGNLTNEDTATKYNDNQDIFADSAENDKLLDFLERLGGGEDSKPEANDKTKNDNNTGSASGTQTRNDYTFANEEFANEKKGTDKPADSGSGSGDSNSDSGSGAASGAQGLGVYTFEDTDTAQHAVRADEGKGNEKPDDNKSDDKSDGKSDEKKSEPETGRAEQLGQAIKDTTIQSTVSGSDGMSK